MRGFTLIELLVVIAILALIVVFAIPNLRSIKEDQNLLNSAAELQSVIRSAQNNATSGVKCGPANPEGVYSSPASDWHLSFTASNPPKFKTEPRCSDSAISSNPSTQYSQSQNLRIIDINGCGEPSIALPVTVSFANITGKATFNFSSSCIPSTTDQMVIKLRSEVTRTVSEIHIEPNGRVYIVKNQ